MSGIVNPSDYFGDNNGYSNETGYYNRQSTSGGDGGSGFGSGSGSSVEQDGYLELLSRIGLFFKPDKTSILTVNSKNFTWSIDTDALIPDTIYIFPDPNKYGDIGNNKSAQYPLIMEHKLNYDIKNTSSGFAKNDPILYLAN
ncbi:MAG: hypothetical protein J6R59_02590 [Paludibacteraceae bacterium]|nr:hypothetical protein [Paludibacteraceae bacterium]